MPRSYSHIRHTPQAYDNITPEERAFAAKYLEHMDARRAIDEVGMPIMSKPLQKKAVQRYIADLQAQRMKRCEITHDDVLRRWWLLANANANELVELRRVCCRYCYGENGEYQRTRAEFEADRRTFNLEQARLAAIGEAATFFAALGGEGYNGTRDPNPECTECWGEGVISVHFKDSRKLSPKGQILYDGVEITKDGSIKLKMRSRSHAEEMISRHVGMLKEAIRRPLLPDEMTDEELNGVIAAQAERLGVDDEMPLIESMETAEEVGK
jgi:phage terminase small subunit